VDIAWKATQATGTDPGPEQADQQQQATKEDECSLHGDFLAII
jgi:hypothetical protein